MVDMAALMEWILSTPSSRFVNGTRWAWPILESLHFMGLVLMVGTVSMFDLRVLGVGKGISPRAVHRLVPFGLIGFVVSICTGVMFISGAPDQYFYNAAFHLKAAFLVLMGLNVTFFYTVPFRTLGSVGAHEEAPAAAKTAAALSLIIMIGVMCCGRMLTFFRPSF